MAVTASMAYAFYQLGERIRELRREGEIGYAAGRLSSEGDFIALFPSYDDSVKGRGLDIAQAQLEQGFQVNLVQGELGDLLYEGCIFRRS